MSGVHSATKPREEFWELLEDDGARRRRAVLLRVVYALVDPRGWDARRHELQGPAAPAAFTLLTR